MDEIAEVAAILKEGAVTLEGAKAEYGIGRTQLYLEMNAGRLAYVQFGRRRLIPRVALRNLLLKRGVVQTPRTREESRTAAA